MGLLSSWNKMEDADLVRAMARGKDRAFRELVQRHQGSLYAYAFKFCSQKEEAEDTVQETFLRLYAKRETLDPDKNIRAFLFRVCRNLLIDHARKMRFESESKEPQVDPSLPPDEALSVRERQHHLIKALETLPEHQKTAMLLRHTEELSYSEIAEIMETTVSAVESLLVRGRKRIREILARTDAAHVPAPRINHL